MAQLNFQGLAPVTFGGRDCKPKMDAEMRLRVQNLKMTNVEKVADVFAECFPDDEDYVRDFVKEQMSSFEHRELQLYLTQGAQAAKEIRDAIRDSIKESMSKKVNEASEGDE